MGGSREDGYDDSSSSSNFRRPIVEEGDRGGDGGAALNLG